MFNKFLDVIYIPPETETIAGIVTNTTQHTSVSSITQVLVAAIVGLIFAAVLVMIAVFAAKSREKTSEQEA